MATFVIPSSTDDAAPRARRALREKYESKPTYELKKYRNLHADVESFAEWSSDKTGACPQSRLRIWIGTVTRRP